MSYTADRTDFLSTRFEEGSLSRRTQSNINLVRLVRLPTEKLLYLVIVPGEFLQFLLVEYQGTKVSFQLLDSEIVSVLGKNEQGNHSPDHKPVHQ